VLIVAPLGADARNISEVLAGAGCDPLVCGNIEEIAREFAHGCGAMVMTEEAMDSHDHLLLSSELKGQPPWSDVPIVLITTGGGTVSVNTTQTIEWMGARANLTLIERPLRASTLVAAVTTALRARARQYEIRDLLADREKLLASLEVRVAERTVKLQQMVEELEAFSYSVSHDLRAPLRVLDGYAQALIEDYGASLEPGAKELLDRISRTAQRMDRLTQDVLAYTRVSRAELVLEPIELESMLRAVIEQYPSLIASSHLIHVHAPLGTVLGHGPSLIQCFSNLLENALKFVRDGELPQIDIYAEPRGDRIRVTVQDHGVGISPAHQDRIFNMFERAAAHKHVPGTGIGLAIVKKAAERMGGSVGVQSEPGNGSRFWLELARADLSGTPGENAAYANPVTGI
jgi:signal transduction histidine kinase